MSAATVPAVGVRVLVFASYAESLGAEAFDLTLPSPARVADVIEHLRSMPGGQQLPPKPLCARNLAHVGPDDTLAPGDEVAVLPPLAGG